MLNFYNAKIFFFDTLKILQSYFSWCGFVLVTSLFFVMHLQAATEINEQATVLVHGVGQVHVVPDEVRFTVGITATKPTAALAYIEVEARMQNAMQVLKQLKIKDHNIQAVSVSLTPVIDYKQREKIIGHKASRDISVKVDDIALYAKAIGALSEVEAVRFSQVSLSSSRQNELELLALEKAYINAETKAKHLVGKSGQHLGLLIEVVEQGAGRQPSPVMRYAATAMMEQLSPAATVSSGVIQVTANVMAKFAIQ